MSMDRELPAHHRRRLLRRRLLWSLLALGCGLLVFTYLNRMLRPSVQASRLVLGAVDRGLVEAAISATGNVVPAFEKVLSSPVEARVLGVLKQPGARIEAGDAIVELDLSESKLELDRLQERLAQKHLEIEGRTAELERRQRELAEQLEVARLELEIEIYRRDQQARLFAEGLTSEERQREAEVSQRKGELEVVAAERASTAAIGEASTDRRRLRLELEILTKERDEIVRRLELATARSDRSGVLTWVVREEGATVGRGDVIARIADLRSFGVEATVSDVHAARLSPGSEARVRFDEIEIRGHIESVHPTIENGVARFVVALERPDHPSLRNNQRVEVDVITERRAGVLRVPRSSFLPMGAVVDVFVVSGDRLQRRKVEVGLRGLDAIEIRSGLELGERIVLSDLRDHSHLTELRLKGRLPVVTRQVDSAAEAESETPTSTETP
ncbi:MAG: HlyD family efflux transporter periplasmic adaptor subunit [Thermoanaerobaculia bacterium]|nr:HlyD family efflux transporter periplasmic adaptor subunit [Thermoanaerobaculia bacterium]